jgi:GT2 family glycosyltransferase
MEPMPQTSPDARAAVGVAVVVLSWNGREDTLACLRSLAEVAYRPLEVIVVDNGSSDGSPDAVAEAFPAVHLIRLDRNTGFSGGVDTGIRAADERGAGAVLLLNNDMVVEPGFLDPLVEALRPGVAAACSQILFADAPERIWYAGASFRPRRGHHGRNIGYGEPPLPADRRPYEVDCACGGAMLIARSAVEQVGLFDERLFAYREDLDWSLRARAEGLRILVAPASVVRHAVSGSSGGASSPTSLYYDTRNGLVVSERHAPLGTVGTWLRRLDSFAAHLAQAVLSPRRAAATRAVARGLRDAVGGRLGERPSH